MSVPDERKPPTTAAVMLDLYETLLSPDWLVLDAGRVTLAERLRADPAVLDAEWRRTQPERFRGGLGRLEDEVGAVLHGCGLSADPELLRELAALERATWLRGLRLYADALPTLRKLRRGGYRTAIVSNCGWQTAAAVEGMGLGAEVDAVVLSCEVGYLKPDPAILRIALERLGLAPERAILVDDRPENLDGARLIGVRTALIARDPASASAANHPRIGALAGLWPLLG